jgi:Fic family protein
MRVPTLMKKFCSWLDQSSETDISPVIASAIAHHQLVTIHPFADGNGRTARALATLVLYQRGYDIKKLFTLDDYYNRDRPAYYHAIRKARSEKDLTSWLEYVAHGLDRELQQVVEQVEHFSREIRGGVEPMYLSKRQRNILEFISMNGKIFRSDVVDIASVSPKTAYRELEFLRNAGLLQRKGRGPTSHYIVA